MRKPNLCIWLRPVLVLALMFLLPAFGRAPAQSNPVEPLPQDSGTAGLKEMLVRLHTTARMLHTVAHPDDEDGGMLTLESRGHGVTAVLQTLNRGEGGQNKLGSSLFDVLGVLRTLELTASDRYYGVEQRFTRVADFGFSKTADETFQKWGGHDVPLADMVRVIRTFRPDVIISRFGGTDRDGHGNHQASGIVTKEAFRAAADPKRFPEQIKEGLRPWQAKKLYIDNVCGFRADTCPEKDWTIKLNVGQKDPLLGVSYLAFAQQGLKHQLSQGAGSWNLTPGDHFEFYRLIDSVLPPTTDKDGHETDFFDGIDTSLTGLAARLGDEQSKVPGLKASLETIQQSVEQAAAAAEKDRASTISALETGRRRTLDLQKTIEAARLANAVKDAVLPSVTLKLQQFSEAIALAGSVEFKVAADVPTGSTPDDAFMAVPGQNFEVTARYATNEPATKATSIKLDLPARWTSRLVTKDATGNQYTARFRVDVSPSANYSRPYWHRADPERDAVNSIDEPEFATLAFPPPPVKAVATLASGAEVEATCMTKFKNAEGQDAERALAVAPPFSVTLEPATEVIPTGHGGKTKIRVAIRTNIATERNASLRLEVPNGWTSEPAAQSLAFQRAGESKDFTFEVRPAALHEGQSKIRAVVDYKGQAYNLGYTVVARADLDTFYYYQPAAQQVSIVDVNVPPDLKVGYVMGAGDDIPTVLQEIGMNVKQIPAESLATAELSQFGTIVLGIRAYDTQKEVVANNKKLLDYVLNGGTLVVQYNASAQDFNTGHFTPYSTELSRARVSVEEVPVDILATDDSVFRYPNQISQKDFENWVQERGLYFMSQWDDHFKPLLSCHDPGEAPQKGGLLRAQYGKGTYIYTGYAFFRQLPAGVPGAIRLYVNLVSAGHEH